MCKYLHSILKWFTFVVPKQESEGIKKQNMARIQNSTEHIFSTSSQNAIRNAMANCSLDEVVTRTNKPHDEVDNVFNFFDTEGNYQFSIDIEGDVIFENHYIS